jgi:hypothetical protein
MDVERVCLALDVEPDEMVDVTRREAARLLHVAAELLEDPSVSVTIALDATNNAGRWLVLCQLFTEGDEVGGGGDGVPNGDVREPLTTAATAQRTRPDDWSEA